MEYEHASPSDIIMDRIDATRGYHVIMLSQHVQQMIALESATFTNILTSLSFFLPGSRSRLKYQHLRLRQRAHQYQR
jgi:hypothetical protein